MHDDIFTLHKGTTPLLVSLPHVGTVIPEALRADYTARALQVEDTDWHLEALYGFVCDMGASLLVPRYSRYVIDLNRPSENTPMYAGSNNTELCPTRHFTGDPIYRDGCAPDNDEVQSRVVRYWQPYRNALTTEMERIQQQHGHAVLLEGHSIKSVLPWLFDGTLPDLNLGTVGGASAHPALRTAVSAVFAAQSEFSHVVDGRFKGGHITRQYGQPARGWHAIQLEMCWKCYMAEDPPYRIDPARAARITPVLRALAQTMIAWRPQ